METPPPYNLPSSVASSSETRLDYKYEFKIIINKCPEVKSFMAMFCQGEPLEKRLIAKRNFYTYTEYDIHFEISLGLVKMTFLVCLDIKDLHRFSVNSVKSKTFYLINDNILYLYHNSIQSYSYYDMIGFLKIENENKLMPSGKYELSPVIKYNQTTVEDQTIKNTYKMNINVEKYIQLPIDFKDNNTIRSILKRIMENFIKEEFYIGKALSEEELKTIAAAKKILENIGKTL